MGKTVKFQGEKKTKNAKKSAKFQGSKKRGGANKNRFLMESSFETEQYTY